MDKLVQSLIYTDISEQYLKDFFSTSTKHDKYSFERMLIKTDLERFSEILWMYGNYLYNKKETDEKRDISKYSDTIKRLDIKYLNNSIKLIKAILKLYSTKQKLFVGYAESKFTFTDFTEIDFEIKHHTSGKENILENFLIPLFRDLDLDKIPYTKEEAKEFLESTDGQIFIHEYWSTFDIKNNKPKTLINDDVIDFYINNYPKTETKIDKNYLNRKLQELEKQKNTLSKGGRKPKNDKIAKIIYQLYFLIKSQSNTPSSISKKPSNNEFNLIYDYLIFFDLLDKENTSRYQQLKTPYNYYLESKVYTTLEDLYKSLIVK